MPSTHVQSEGETKPRMPHRQKHLRPDMRLKTGGPKAERVAQLLSDRHLSLSEVADRIREEFPEARTTARSVSSVAVALRREGYVVPKRIPKPRLAKPRQEAAPQPEPVADGGDGRPDAVE